VASYNFVSRLPAECFWKARIASTNSDRARYTQRAIACRATPQHGMSWEGSERLDSTIGVQKALILFVVVVSTSQDDTGRDALRHYRIHK
jgi:hypothetical protein